MKMFKMMLVTASALSLFSCVETQPWEQQVRQAKFATEKYVNFSIAEAEGRIDVSGYVPNMGHHYLNPALVDDVFDINNPEIILYKPDANGKMQMVAIEYSVLPDANGNPPEGFDGDDDVWVYKEALGQWQLHVWTKLENPDGIFKPYNTAIGD